jgi:predicted phosphodiesterase
MALGFLGDIHGHTGVFHSIASEVAKRPEVKALIQVGDFGITKDALNHYRNNPPEIVTYFICGNHEDHPLLKDYTELTELAPNLFYCPRGTVLKLDGKTIAFMGGAASVDKEYRLRNGWMWHEEENITSSQVGRFRRNTTGKKIDIMVVHNPPQWIIQKHFNPLTLLQFGLPATWTDVNADIIEDLWKEIGEPVLISGHMHKTVVDGNCRILDINELHCIL